MRNFFTRLISQLSARYLPSKKEIYEKIVEKVEEIFSRVLVRSILRYRVGDISAYIVYVSFIERIVGRLFFFFD